jgi:hypothetical protein
MTDSVAGLRRVGTLLDAHHDLAMQTSSHETAASAKSVARDSRPALRVEMLW